MSRKPAKKIISAPVKNRPTAKKAAAPKFTTSPRNVRRLGLIPVAAITPTILSSSHLLPVPIWMENLNFVHPSNVLDGESASSYSREVQETSNYHDERTQPPQFSAANRNRSQRRVGRGELACPAIRRKARA